jgi:hypothetical protein
LNANRQILTVYGKYNLTVTKSPDLNAILISWTILYDSTQGLIPQDAQLTDPGLGYGGILRQYRIGPPLPTGGGSLQLSEQMNICGYS